MPQELQILNCYNCSTFQVHIVKKSTKWECKICNEKQSIKKVYGRGSGKECRLQVQYLNEKRLQKDSEYVKEHDGNFDQEPSCYILPASADSFTKNTEPAGSKWLEFTNNCDTTEDKTDSSDLDKYTFERPTKTNSKQTKKVIYKPTENISECSSYESPYIKCDEQFAEDTTGSIKVAQNNTSGLTDAYGSLDKINNKENDTQYTKKRKYQHDNIATILPPKSAEHLPLGMSVNKTHTEVSKKSKWDEFYAEDENCSTVNDANDQSSTFNTETNKVEFYKNNESKGHISTSNKGLFDTEDELDDILQL